MLVSWIMCYFLYVFIRIKYYFKAEISIESQVPDMDQVQRTTAQFRVPPMSAANIPLNIRNITSSLLNSSDAFTSRGSGWVISQKFKIYPYILNVIAKVVEMLDNLQFLRD